jgi:transposase InsO family protein
VKPVTVNELNQRGQIDLVDFQTLPDGNFKFVMHYQEHLTKYHLLSLLTTKRAVEVARRLLKIFLDFVAPRVLQSDNGREYTAEIIRELSTPWPELVLVNGRPRHPQSQGSAERSNATLKDSLVAWMRDNNTSNWSTGLMFVQWSMNTTYHEAIKMEPYKDLFGVKPKIGLGTSLPSVSFKQNSDRDR